ncbi:MAG TPA: hypothetical protein VF992_07905 [Thermoplasmata archaeon]
MTNGFASAIDSMVRKGTGPVCGSCGRQVSHPPPCRAADVERYAAAQRALAALDGGDQAS